MDKIWAVRVKSIGTEFFVIVGMFLLTAIGSFFGSDEFSGFLTKSFGVQIGTLVFVVVQNVVKHLMNLRKVGKLGAIAKEEVVLI